MNPDLQAVIRTLGAEIANLRIQVAVQQSVIDQYKAAESKVTTNPDGSDE